MTLIIESHTWVFQWYVLGMFSKHSLMFHIYAHFLLFWYLEMTRTWRITSLVVCTCQHTPNSHRTSSHRLHFTHNIFFKCSYPTHNHFCFPKAYDRLMFRQDVDVNKTIPCWFEWIHFEVFCAKIWLGSRAMYRFCKLLLFKKTKEAKVKLIYKYCNLGGLTSMVPRIWNVLSSTLSLCRNWYTCT